MHQIHISTTEGALLECLICSDCGCVEAYVPAKGDLAKMAQKFERYSPVDSEHSGEADKPADGDSSATD